MELVTQVSDCYPTPQIQWIKDDLSISNDNEHFILESDNNLHKLIVSSSLETDKGKYLFKANNDLGEAETSCNININRNIFLIAIFVF